MASFSSIGVFDTPLIAFPTLAMVTSPFDTVMRPTEANNRAGRSRRAKIRVFSGFMGVPFEPNIGYR